MLAECMLSAELRHHLANEGEGSKNHRNGTSPKRVMTPGGELNLDIPRDRLSSFEPKLVAKHQRRMPGFDDHVISMYARGMSVREIQGHLLELCGTEVSPDLVSTITDEVLEEVTQWQQRPLEAMYPIVYFDALRLKIRAEGTVKNKAVNLALGIRADGRKEVLGLWIEQTEGAKFWLKVFDELKNRGPDDILIAVVDGLRGFPEAIEAVYPQAQIQTCIVHLIRNSTTLAAWKDRKELAAALKPVYQAGTPTWPKRRSTRLRPGLVGHPIPDRGGHVAAPMAAGDSCFAYPPEVRTIIYTTNAIESLHMRLRKIVKNRGHVASDEAATKSLFLALRNIEKDWKMPQRTRKQAANQFAIMFGERFTNAIT